VSFAAGVRAFLDGAQLARAPGLRRYTWMPLLVSLVIVVGGLAVALAYVGDVAAWLVAQLPDWLGFLGYVLVPLLYLLTVLGGAWLFALLAVLVASPFLGDLSIAVERMASGTGPEHIPSLWASVLGSIGREVRKLGYYLPRLLLVFVLTLIPVLNALAPLLWFAFGAWIMAIQFCDYPTENRARPFRDTLTLLQRNRATALGYGSCATLLMSIPLVNLLFIPAAVAGGTLLWQRLQAETATAGDR
jgi:CysZ protein